MKLHDTVGDIIRSLKKKASLDGTIIDNEVFRMHYKITLVILLVSTIAVTTEHLTGSPIRCLSNLKSHTTVIETFCWTNYTHTIPNAKNITEKGIEGLGNDYNEEKTYHSYYQWVPAVLFAQCILFYAPHWMWKQWENGKIQGMCKNLRGLAIHSKTERETHVQQLSQYIKNSLHLHNSYAVKYFFCEILNFVNVVANVCMMNSFLGGKFLSYGWNVLSFANMSQEERMEVHDPMVTVFPRLTKCTFYKWGQSGTIQNFETICVLAVNVVNEKIFLFLWFWFIILAVASAVALIYRFIFILFPGFRKMILKHKKGFNSNTNADIVVNKIGVSDFLILHLVSQNINFIFFNEVLEKLVDHLKG